MISLSSVGLMPYGFEACFVCKSLFIIIDLKTCWSSFYAIDSSLKW